MPSFCGKDEEEEFYKDTTRKALNKKLRWFATLTINEPHLPTKNSPRCCVKQTTVQDTFRPIPGIISCAGVTGRWGLLTHAQNAVRWLVLSKRLVEGLQRSCTYTYGYVGLTLTQSPPSITPLESQEHVSQGEGSLGWRPGGR